MVFVSADSPPLPSQPSRSEDRVLVAARSRVWMTGKELLGTHGDHECTPDFVQTVGCVVPGPE